VVRNAIAAGELGPLLVYATAPFLFAALVRAASDDAEATDRARERSRRQVTILGIGLTTAVTAAFWPPAFFVTATMAAALLLAIPFVGGTPGAVRATVVAVGGAAVGALLVAPWVLTLFGADPATLALLPRAPLSFDAMLHFQTGPSGSGIASLGLLVAAAVPLFIANGERFAWATRAWLLVLLSFAWAWLPSRISPTAPVPAPEGVLVGAALGLALACGVGVAAFLAEVRSAHFGWRQLLAVVAAVALTLPLLGLAADAVSGRWGLPDDDWPTTFSWMDDQEAAGGFRVLWVGDPDVLPVGTKVTDGVVGYALTRDGVGDARASWAAPETDADQVIGNAIASARAGDTARLGHLLAPAGIRYIAYITRAAPDDGEQGRPDATLRQGLARQLDLALSHSDAASAVYENEAWIPHTALVPPDDTSVQFESTDPVAGALRSEPSGVTGVERDGDETEPTGPGTLLWSEAGSDGWHADADGTSLDRTDAFGWTNAFAMPEAAAVDISYQAGALRVVATLFSIFVPLAAAAVLVRTRRRLRRVEEDAA
jgi:hypothetical protein